MCRPPQRREHALTSSPLPLEQAESHRNLLRLLEQLRADCICGNAEALIPSKVDQVKVNPALILGHDNKELPYYHELDSDLYTPEIHRPASSLYSYNCGDDNRELRERSCSTISLKDDAIIISQEGSPWTQKGSPLPPPLHTPSSEGSTYINSGHHESEHQSQPSSCLYVAASEATLVDEEEPHFNSSYEKIEYAERFVDAAVCVMESIWPVSTLHTHPAMTLPPLRLFVHEFLRRSRTSFPALQLALFYLARLRAHLSAVYFSFDPAQDNENDVYFCGPISPIYHPSLRCGRRMFLTALMSASKYLLDRPPSNLAWARLGGLELEHLNTVEASFLGAIQFDLFVSPQSWAKLRAGSTKLADHGSPEDFARTVFDAAGTEVRGFALAPKKLSGARYVEQWRFQVDTQAVFC
ncbi:hypothetical protein BJ742DRAFT_750306 [Cladochytrium replicatum]|nr:hypothetical protein BJ742DRAFT_750306 [Cladochytrium replicatum]